MKIVSCKLTIGSWSINTADDPHTEFIELCTRLSLDFPADECQISVYPAANGQIGIIEGLAAEAAGAVVGGEGAGETFSVQVRGNGITYGDPISIELSAGNVSEKIMTAEVQKIESSFGLTTITGRTGMQKLANTRLNQVYQNQNLNQIVTDLAGQAGVNTGEIDRGSSYPYFVVHESINLLKHIRELAMREGMDFYFDTDNKLTIQKFNKSNADYAFAYGRDILDLELFNHQMTREHVLVYGESPSSNQGADTWHWIAKDIAPFKSEAGQGVKTLAIQDGVIRTKDAADTFARSKFGAIRDNAARGRLKILGYPNVKLGEAIEIREVQKPELNGLFKITSVRHVLNKQNGYLTFIDFTGLGGASVAGELLGQLSGGMSGAPGL